MIVSHPSQTEEDISYPSMQAQEKKLITLLVWTNRGKSVLIWQQIINQLINLSINSQVVPWISVQVGCRDHFKITTRGEFPGQERRQDQ